MKEVIRKLSSFDKLAFASGDVAISLSIISAAFLIFTFHVQVLGIKPIDAGWILLVARFVDAISDPLMGFITSKVNTKWGRYRPWLVIASVPLGLSLVLMFTHIEGSYQSKLIWATGTYIFNTLMFTALTIPYISLVGVITNDPKERLSANTYRFIIAKIATLLVTTFVPYMVISGDNSAQSYASSFLVLAIISIVFALFCAIYTPEQVRTLKKTPSFLVQFRGLIKNDQWRILALSIVLVTGGILARGTVALIYATTFLAAGEGFEAALFMGMWSFGGMVAAYCSKILTDRYSKIRVFEYSMYATVFLGALAYFLVPQGAFVMGVIFFFLLSFASEIQSPILWAIITEVGDYGKIRTGVDASGLTVGSLAFCQKLGMGISGPVIGYALAYYGYDANATLSAETLDGISITMWFVPSVFFLLGGLMIRKYIIDNKYYKSMILENE